MSFDADVTTFLDYLTIERGYSDHTRESYARDLRHFAAHCAERGESCARDVAPETVYSFVDYLARKRAYKSSSAARSLAAARTFLKFLTAEGVLKKNPAAHSERPKQWKRLPHVLSPENAELLTQAPREALGVNGQRKLPLRDTAIIELLYASGMRVSELCRLAVADLSFEEHTVRVTGKGEKTRIIPVGSVALAAVREYLIQVRPKWSGTRDGGKLFLSKGGRPMAREDVWALVKKHGRAAGLTGKYSPHTLRHSFATHLLEGGAVYETDDVAGRRWRAGQIVWPYGWCYAGAE